MTLRFLYRVYGRVDRTESSEKNRSYRPNENARPRQSGDRYKMHGRLVTESTSRSCKGERSVMLIIIIILIIISSIKKKKLFVDRNPSLFLETMEFEPITADSLRQEKSYQKMARKQQKDLDSLRKRHQKEKLTVQKQQCAAIEKLIKGKK